VAGPITSLVGALRKAELSPAGNREEIYTSSGTRGRRLHKAGAFCSSISVPVHLRAPNAKRRRRRGEREDKKRTRLFPPSLRAYPTSVQSSRGQCRRRRRHCTSAALVSCRPGDLSSSSVSSLGGSLGVRGPRSVRILGV